MLRLKGKPFEIVNVSLDDAKTEVVTLTESAKFPGIHTWDEKGPENPIAELYNAHRLPTWYLIDGRGIIRARDPFGDKLVPAIESIVAPTEGAAAKVAPGANRRG